MPDKTIRDLMEFIEARALDSDEYFLLDRQYRENLDQPLFADDTRWIACYYAIGSNEGWYLHVDRVCNSGPGDSWRSDHMATGKYWSAYQAMIAVALITEWIYEGTPYARYILAKREESS